MRCPTPAGKTPTAGWRPSSDRGEGSLEDLLAPEGVEVVPGEAQLGAVHFGVVLPDPRGAPGDTAPRGRELGERPGVRHGRVQFRMIHRLPEPPRRELRVVADVPGAGDRIPEDAAFDRLARKLGLGALRQRS